MGFFDGFAGSALGAVGNLVGGFLGSSGQSSLNSANIAASQAAENFQHNERIDIQNWETQMSNTAYQRAMADMKAAGLNPILAANLGGASTPGSPGLPIGQVPNLGNVSGPMAAGIASAGQAGVVAAQLRATGAQADKDTAMAETTKTQGDLYAASADNLRAQTGNVAATGDKIRADTVAADSASVANRAAAAASTAAAGLDAARTVQAVHDANTARINSQLRQLDLEKAQVVGAPAAGPVGRTFQDLGQIAGNAVNTVRNMFRGAVDMKQSGQGPQAPSSARSVQGLGYIPSH